MNLGDWTDGEIFRAITAGVNKEGEALFPVMPYRNYSKMDREDIYDIIAYLRTLPPIENEIPHSNSVFPMNLIINTFPEEPEFSDRPDLTDKVEYGAYLANAASCIECHTPTVKGEVISELAFSGGREFRMPEGLRRSPNITPHEQTGIGLWEEKAFVNRFKAYSDSMVPVEEGDFNSIMPWSMYAGMETSDLEAIFAYLSTLEPVENQVVVFEENF